MDDRRWNKIASQFDLPERQAKVKQLLKINEPDDSVWCICRTSDSSSFMICCDKCDEWYHGKCIGLKERESKKIKKYYCDKCREIDHDLEILYKPQYAEKMQQKKQKRLRVEDEALQTDSESSNTKKSRIFDSSKASETPKRKLDTPKSSVKSAQRPTPAQSVKSGSNFVDDSEVIFEIKQCFGPGCCEAARANSKYCGDDCGMNLARNRIFELLPWRVSQWVATPSAADLKNKKDLEILKHEREILHERLSDLERKKQRLEEFIARAKSTQPYDKSEIDEDGNGESSAKNTEEAQMDCVSCGNPQPAKMAFRHMERCFARLECQTTCMSLMRTRIEGDSMLCDYYSAQNDMYCKRLKHICPEHYKEEKNDQEVCGCPIVNVLSSSQIFETCFCNTSGGTASELPCAEFCRQLKCRCHRHVAWDRLRRAHIDLERFKMWSKLEELLERENQIRFALTQRAGVVSLLLNETIDCNPSVSLSRNSVCEPESSISPEQLDEHQYCTLSTKTNTSAQQLMKMEEG